MNTITCTSCGDSIEIDKALEGQIEARVMAAEKHKHSQALDKLKNQQIAELEKERALSQEVVKKQIEGEKELLRTQSMADLEIEKKKIIQLAANERRKNDFEQENLIKNLQNDAESSKEDNKKLRQDLSKLMDQLRVSNVERDNAEIEAKKKMNEEALKIREEIQKSSDEKQRYDLAAKNKTIEDLQKALDSAQRKAAQGSQQLQGEVMELDLETALANAYRDDDFLPVAKGTKGGDILQTVKSPRGIHCGVIIWEIKRTKNWTDSWIAKLKEDLRSARANIPVIVSEVMPKQVSEGIGQFEGVWVCKPKFAIILSGLLRKGLLDAGYQKALAENRGEKADALYSFVTSHEFIQQIESMVETYQDMNAQVMKERVAYEKMWAQREKQSQKLLMGTANIIGSMQGYIGQASMPRIKGLELNALDE